MNISRIIPGNSAQYVECSTHKVSQHLQKLQITIPKEVTIPIEEQILFQYQHHSIPGFSDQLLPAQYASQYFKNEISQDSQSFLLHYILLPYIFEHVITHDIPLINWPRIETITKNDDRSITFSFDTSVSDPIETIGWRNLKFTPPPRKKYKEINIQVSQFIETIRAKETASENLIGHDDWIRFVAIPLAGNVKLQPQAYWLHIVPEEIPDAFHDLFIGKFVGEAFTSNILPLGSGQIKSACTFSITPTHRIPGNNNSFDLIKLFFNLENNDELHDKLAEVFSFCNDISQRRLTVDEALRRLLSHFRFEAPLHSITRRTEVLRNVLHSDPEYAVYEHDKKFLEDLSQLAEQQIKQEVMLDHIAKDELIVAGVDDIQRYLSFFMHARIKEFIHFQPLGHELGQVYEPIQETLLLHTVRREKTLNMVIEEISIR